MIDPEENPVGFVAMVVVGLVLFFGGLMFGLPVLVYYATVWSRWWTI